jgi:AAA+ superfamily predicted ATPase
MEHEEIGSETRIVGMSGADLPDFLRNMLGSSGLGREERNKLIKSYLGVKNLANTIRIYRKYPVTFNKAISFALEELSTMAENLEKGRTEELPNGAPISCSYDDEGLFEDVLFGGEFRLNRRRVRAVIETNVFRHPGLMVFGPEGWVGSDHTSFSVYAKKEDKDSISSIFEIVDSYVYEGNTLRGKIINVYGEEENIGNYDWDDIAIPQYFIQEIEENIIWPIRYHEKIEAANIRLPRGIMLEGERGMGKTLLSMIIANKVRGKGTFIKAKPSDVQRLGWDYIFDVARVLEPCVLYIEDIEALAPSKQKFGLVSASLTDILDYLDGMESRGNVTLLASTNVPDMVDFGLLDRPGRIDRRLVFDPRNNESFGFDWKKKVFEIHLRGHKLAPGLSTSHLAKMIGDVPYTGSHIEELIHTATLEALRREKMESMDAAEIEGKICLTLEDFKRAKERIERVVRQRMGPEIV